MNIVLRTVVQYRVVAIALAAMLLVGCGGGGGGGTPSPPDPTPPTQTPDPDPDPAPDPDPEPDPVNSLSGEVLLGAVAAADVEIIGSEGPLATGVTNEDGSFGPIEYPGTYTGPLRIRVTGNAASTWECDLYAGCEVGDQDFSFGERIPFETTLEAIIPQAGTDQFVAVSLLSHFASIIAADPSRFTTTDFEIANDEIAGMINSVLGIAFDAVGSRPGGDFNSVDLPDLNRLADAGGTTAQGALLALLNSSLLAGNVDAESLDTFIPFLAQQVAGNPSLVAAALDPRTPTFIRLMNYVRQQLAGADAANADIDALLGSLTSSTLDSLLEQRVASFPSLEADSVFDFVPFFINSLALRQESFIATAPPESGINNLADELTFRISGNGPAELINAPTVFNSSEGTVVRLSVNAVVADSLPNGTYTYDVEMIASSYPEIAPENFQIAVYQQIDTGTLFNMSTDYMIQERTVGSVAAFTNRTDVSNVDWLQLQGPPVELINPGELTSPAFMPSVSKDEDLTFRATVSFENGDVFSGQFTITVLAYRNIDDLLQNFVTDDALAACIAEAAAASGYTDVEEFRTLSCEGVNIPDGVGMLVGLTDLDLSNGTLLRIPPVGSLGELERLNLDENPDLSCAQLDQLETSIGGAFVLVLDDTCRRATVINLGAFGSGTALADGRQRVYVSVPDRQEIAVISIPDERVIERIEVPGQPLGMDVSDDETKLYVALDGSSAVAEIDLDTSGIAIIDVGAATNSAAVRDVVVGASGRVFVTAGTDGSFVGQVQTEMGNAVSTAASARSISGNPGLTSSADGRFVYVGENDESRGLYKLDLDDPDAGVVLDETSGNLLGASQIAVSPSGGLIALAGGQVLDTETFFLQGLVPPGAPIAGRATNRLFMGRPQGSTPRQGEVVFLETFDFTSLDATGIIDTTCARESAFMELELFDNDTGIGVRQSRTYCLSRQVARGSPPADAYAALRFPDLALEACVINAAIANNYTLPEEFTTLDCSASPGAISNITGISVLANITSLNLSNSDVFDLEPIDDLDGLQTLTMRDARLSDARPLNFVSSLASVDLSGNPDIACEDLWRLVSSDITVQADFCTIGDDLVLGTGGARPSDLVLDEANDRLFVSVPEGNAIYEFALSTRQPSGSYAVRAPRGMDLSSDGSVLYVASDGDIGGDQGALGV
ncbi:MAG: hypothetical protein AAFX10_02130, partial [Pseudomonadota bacterium]